MTSIDLNSDIGEGFGRWTLGDDAAMLEVVSSANIACGFHAGDPRGMLATARTAVRTGSSIGAHVGYRDLAGFGRRDLDVASADLVPEIVYQIGALQALAAVAGGRVSYVKPHGALYNRIAHDERQAADVVRAVRDVDDSLVLLGLPGSVVLRIAEEQGLRTAREAFADRAYTADGRLVPRNAPGSVLHDPDEVAIRMLRLVETGELVAVDGSTIALRADSICVHGDTPGAAAMAGALRRRLESAGVRIGPFAPAP
ncbi:5-oxoprolinase subunit PxpA [Nakamurella sp. A5-74]|uniref:5-oxoprolinase subunit A n=1 Tax=Nakamurella sp. A5-74 TaxID=3158264 RepID=A0AAU8DQ02_9ACTN